MKLRDFLTVVENKKNKQIHASIKKKKLCEVGMSVDDFLDFKIKKSLKMK